ncbi:MAG TPA: hypothetical protein VFX16_31785 [Pseudonocardiaceae bacterium]|nr:hypothetical protein [Pseudonocardiaceae bacterium]
MDSTIRSMVRASWRQVELGPCGVCPCLGRCQLYHHGFPADESRTSSIPNQADFVTETQPVDYPVGRDGSDCQLVVDRFERQQIIRLGAPLRYPAG